MVTPEARVHTVIGFQSIDQGFGAQALWVKRAVDVGKRPSNNGNHGTDTGEPRDQARGTQGRTGR
jgi:hypothetical protein